MNKYLNSMKKNYLYGILIILLIASIILGYFLYKEKKRICYYNSKSIQFCFIWINRLCTRFRKLFS